MWTKIPLFSHRDSTAKGRVPYCGITVHFLSAEFSAIYYPTSYHNSLQLAGTILLQLSEQMTVLRRREPLMTSK
jgi:hypothetical protein